MSSFLTLKIKTAVCEKFRIFAHEYGSNQSKCLDDVLTFFERNKVNPKDDISGSFKDVKNAIQKSEDYLIKRFDAQVAILRNIEKQHILPMKNGIKELYLISKPSEIIPEAPHKIIDKTEENKVSQIKNILDFPLKNAARISESKNQITLSSNDILLLKRHLNIS